LFLGGKQEVLVVANLENQKRNCDVQLAGKKKTVHRKIKNMGGGGY